MTKIKYIALLLFACFCSCSGGRSKIIDVYFNSASLVTKKFDIEIISQDKVLFDTLLNRTTVDKYRKIGSIRVKSNENYKIIVNGIDSLVRNDMKHSKLFIGYQEEFLYPEGSNRGTKQVEDELTFDKKHHRLILQLEE